mmetsp:Transcript_47863/g.147592  ORF Transcript_47863/g.147592 Transcript_47863/m.147592 type:complete len:267 (+) Transcript_47863:259-1059(+)
MRYHLEGQLLLGQRHVHEAVLVVVARVQRHVLRGDAAAAPGDHPGGGVQEVAHLEVGLVLGPDPRRLVGGAVHVLGVPVACDDSVDLVLRREGHPVALAPVGREVRHYNAPVGLGLGHDLAQPLLLVLPKVVEPLLAVLRAPGGPACRAAVRRQRVVRAADVVRRPHAVRQRVPVVGVHEVVVDREVGVLHRDVVVERRRHPAVLGEVRLAPGVADRLVPGHVEAPAAPVVVAQDAEPSLAVQAVPVVNVLEDLLELVHGLLLVLL